MTTQPRDHEFLARARSAFKVNNASAMHLYYVHVLLQSPDNGNLLSEYLDAIRGLHRSGRQIVDVQPDLTLSRFLPGQPVQKQYESALEKLKTNPYDLDVVYKIARNAQSAGRHATAVAALRDVMKLSPSARTTGHKLGREVRFALGKSYYQLKEYKSTFDILKEFQGDPTAPKEILQLIKDSAASLASVTFQQSDSAHKMATSQSAALATQSQEECTDQEIKELTASIAAPKAEPARVALAALKLADLHGRAHAYEQALDVLAQALEICGQNSDLEKKRVAINLRKKDHEIAEVEARLKQNPDLKSALDRLILVRDQYLVQAYTDLSTRMPADGEMHLSIGEGLFMLTKRTGDEALLKDAIGHLQFDFKTDEQIDKARLLLAECFMDLRLPHAAEVILIEFLARLESQKKSGEHFLEANYLLGIVREKCGDVLGARNSYTAVIGRNIQFKDAYERIKNLEVSQ